MPPRMDMDDLATQREKFDERFAGCEREELELISPEERARQAHFNSLSMSYARTLEQHRRATNPAHRLVLERALRYLEDEMCKP